jgi:cytochrome P450
MNPVVSPTAPPRRTAADFPLYAPGPKYWGPINAVRKDPIGYHLKAVSLHGPIYRTTYHGRESLCIGGLEANDFVWRNSALWDYSITRASFQQEFGSDYLTGLNGQKHKDKRRRLNPAFRPDFLFAASPRMSATVRGELAAAAPGPVELRLLCHRLLLNMTAHALLGLVVPLPMQRAIIRVERDLLLGGGKGPGRDAWFQRPVYTRAKAKVVGYLGQLAEAWMAKPAAAPEMFQAILREPEGSGDPLTAKELLGDIYLLLTGGLNSTANLVLWTLMQVYHRPDWLEQLRAEIQAAPPEKFTAMKDWPKIKATVLEIERLRPPTPINTLVAAADCEYQGIAIPKGSALTHFLSLTHFTPEIYAEPHEFRPERFLGDATYPPKAHAAFGGGAHMCIGMPLARLEVPLILATILPRYDLVFRTRPSFAARHGAALTPRERGLWVTLQERA